MIPSNAKSGGLSVVNQCLTRRLEIQTLLYLSAFIQFNYGEKSILIIWMILTDCYCSLKRLLRRKG